MQAIQTASTVTTDDSVPGLLSCCRYVAEQKNLTVFAGSLAALKEQSDPTGRKATLEKVLQAAQREGLQTIILRPNAEQLAALHHRLPVVVEMRDGRYCILSGLTKNSSGSPESVTLL